MAQMCKHVNIVREMRAINSNSEITVNFEHIYWHQDDLESYDMLDRPVLLNIMCDTEAKDFLRTLIAQNAPPPPWTPTHTWGCWINGTLMTGNIGPTIRRAIVEDGLKDYIHNKGCLHKHHFKMVDWDSIGRAMEVKH